MFIKFYWKNISCLLFIDFKIRSLLNAILVSTWLIFRSENLPKSCLGGLLGRLGRILGRHGGLLGCLGAVLEASWAVFEALWNI